MLLVKAASIFTGLLVLSTVNCDDRSSHPYAGFVHAQPLNGFRRKCSVAILKRDFVITATNCIKDAHSFLWRLGLLYANQTVTEYACKGVDGVTINETRFDSDDGVLSLLRLDPRCVLKENELEATLPPPESYQSQRIDAIAANGTVVGFVDLVVSGLEYLDAMPVRIKDYRECRSAYPNSTIEKLICAEVDGEDIDGKYPNLCKSEGAPLIIFNRTLVGINIEEKCDDDKPMRFARINFYQKWILDTFDDLKYKENDFIPGFAKD